MPEVNPVGGGKMKVQPDKSRKNVGTNVPYPGAQGQSTSGGSVKLIYESPNKKKGVALQKYNASQFLRSPQK